MGILRTNEISGLETPTAVTGSVSFDGSGDYLSLASSVDFAWGTGDFTWEAWVYSTASDHTSGNHYIFDLGGGNIAAMSFYQNKFNYYNSTIGLNGQLGSFPANKWTHIAVSRKNLISYIFIDGILQDSISDTHNYGTTALVAKVGVYASNNTLGWSGYISNLRILKGTALYTSDFTPPVHELQPIGDTVLLCCNNPDSAGAEATGKTITVNGNAAASTVSPGLTRDFTFGTQFQGVAKFDTQGYFVPPSGTTEQRGRGRGLNAGGGAPYSNIIEYIDIQTLGNAQDFGDLTIARAFVSAVSSPTRAVFANGYNNSPGVGSYNIMDYVTISTTGNAVDFGAETTTAQQSRGSCSNNTRGVFAGGSATNALEYITIASLGTIQNFGEYRIDRYRDIGGCSSSTRGLFAGGFNPANTNSIEYITIATTGNTQSFGDLTSARFGPGAASSPTRGVFLGGDTFPALSGSVTIDFVTISSLGNAQDFGDLTFSSYRVAATSNGNRAVAFQSSPSPAGVNTINYVTIASTGNAQDFGDRFYNIAELADSATSDSHGGIS